MYAFVLITHSWMRWPVLIAGVLLLVLSLTDWRRGAPFTPGRNKLRAAAVGLMDLQLVLGLWLYLGLSPVASAALSDMGAAMKDPTLRFFGVEHAFTMILALIVLHVGHVRARRAEDGERHRLIFITQCIWLVLVLASIPWPGLDIGRPLFRM